MQTEGTFAKPQKQGFKRTIRYLGASSTWSFGLFTFFFLILSIISLLTDVVSESRFNALWFIVSGAGFIPPLLIGFLYRILYLKEQKKVNFLINTSVAVLAGASRNVSVGIFADWAGLDESGLWLFRFIGGGFMGFAIFSLWAFANGSKFDYVNSLEELSKTQSRLVATRLEIPDQLEEINDGLQERTRNAIFPQLQAIRDLLGSSENLSQVLEKLKFTISSQIRPMMSDLAESQPKPFAVKNINRLKTVKSSLPERFTLRDKINLGWASFLETLGVSIWLWVYPSPNGLLDNVALFSIYLFVLGLFKFLVPSQKKIPRFNAIFFTLIAALAASFSNTAYIYLVLGFDPGKSFMFAGFALLSGVMGPILLLQLAVRNERRAEIEAQVSADLMELTKENALFAQKLWVFRKRWLLVLHGSVQSSLTAALARLQSATEVTPVLVELVKQDLARAEAAVDSGSQENLDLNSGFQALQEVWAGICNINVQISARAQRAIEKNPDTGFCVNEISKEAISNAVRHGEASEANIFIDRTEDDILQVEISNNGSQPAEDKSVGIGTEMLNDVCINWHLTSERKLVRLFAELPVKL
jgi:signal transduction histidine kinase